jgi:hypothetical protein
MLKWASAPRPPPKKKRKEKEEKEEVLTAPKCGLQFSA